MLLFFKCKVGSKWVGRSCYGLFILGDAQEPTRHGFEQFALIRFALSGGAECV